MSNKSNTQQIADAPSADAPSAQQTVAEQLAKALEDYTNDIAAIAAVEKPSCVGNRKGYVVCGCGYAYDCIENTVDLYADKRALNAKHTRKVCNIKYTGLNTANCVCAHCIYMTTPFAYLFGVLAMIVATPICCLCDFVQVCDGCCV